MRCRRSLAVLTAALLLAISVGCGSEEKKDSRSANSSGQEAESASRPVAASSSPSASPSNPTPSANGAARDALPATTDHLAVVIINLRRLVSSPLLAEKLKDEKVAGAIKNFGIDPREVEEIVVPIGLEAGQAGQSKLTAFLITRFTHDVDAKEVLARLGVNGPIHEVQFGGKTCLDLIASHNGLAYVPSKDTIILASTEIMGKVLATAGAKGPLYERFKKAAATKDLVMAANFEKQPGMDKQLDGLKKDVPPPLRNYLEAAKTLREWAIALDLTGDVFLQIGLEAKDAAAAAAIESLFQDTKRMLGGLLAGSKQNASPQAKAEYADTYKLGEEAVDSIRVIRSGAQVTVTMQRPASLDNAGPLVDKLIRAYVLLAMGGGETKPTPPPGAHRPIPGQPR